MADNLIKKSDMNASILLFWIGVGVTFFAVWGGYCFILLESMVGPIKDGEVFTMVTVQLLGFTFIALALGGAIFLMSRIVKLMIYGARK